MGKIYKWGVNPFRDFLLNSIMFDVDISEKGAKQDINSAFTYILTNLLNNEKDVLHLDFEIKNKGDYFRVLGNNSVSALWLSGIIPIDTDSALKNNTFTVKDRKYIYNSKKKTLTYTILKN